MRVSVQFHAQADLPHGKSPRYHWIGDCLGARAGLDAVVKRKILSGIEMDIVSQCLTKRSDRVIMLRILEVSDSILYTKSATLSQFSRGFP
jgi:hypothetical protein